MDLLGTPEEPLPPAYWSPLALQLRPQHWTRPGLIGAGCAVVAGRCRALLLKRPRRSRLEPPPPGRLLRRHQANVATGCGGTPWHLASLGDWHALATVLVDPGFLRVAWPRHKNELKSYWVGGRGNAAHGSPTLCQPMTATPDASARGDVGGGCSCSPRQVTTTRPCGSHAGGPKGGVGRLPHRPRRLAEPPIAATGRSAGLSEQLAEEAARSGDTDARIDALLRVGTAHADSVTGGRGNRGDRRGPAAAKRSPE